MREFKRGNTTLIIHSPLMDMTKEERKEWFDTEMEKGNPALLAVAEAMRNGYRKHDQ